MEAPGGKAPTDKAPGREGTANKGSGKEGRGEEGGGEEGPGEKARREGAGDQGCGSSREGAGAQAPAARRRGLSMQIRIVAVGTKMPAWVGAAVDDYARRLPGDWRVEWREGRAEARGASGHPGAWVQREAERIRGGLPAGGRPGGVGPRGRS